MSKQHQDTCLVNVGDTMPDARLADLNGKEQDLAKLLGDRLTVIFFWTVTDRHSVDELGDLAAKVASPLAAKGVKVVGICERDSAEEARKRATKRGFRIRCSWTPTASSFLNLPRAACRGHILSMRPARFCGSTSNTQAPRAAICAKPCGRLSYSNRKGVSNPGTVFKLFQAMRSMACSTSAGRFGKSRSATATRAWAKMRTRFT